MLACAGAAPGQEKHAENGRVVFRIYCAPCHGIHAEGGRGPDLTLGSYSAGDTDTALFHTIRGGVTGTEMPAFPDFADDIVSDLVTYIRSAAKREAPLIAGDRIAGERLFWTKGGCGACHQVGAKGGSLGPDLTRAGRQRSYAYLKTSVIAPDAEISPGYESITVITREGTKVAGVQRGFDNFSAQLVDLSGKFYSFDKSGVRSITREFRSVMPGDYSARFTSGEMDDLLAYVSSLKGPQ